MEKRKIFISNDILSLVERVPEIDDTNDYECWQDEATQDGYNFKFNMTLEEFCNRPVKSRFVAAIQRNSDSVCIGSVSVSPEGSLPDLAIMLYKPFRHHGYGTNAFSLAVKYCFDVLKIDKLYAGCYETNIISQKMLTKCGFQPNPQGNQLEDHYLTGNPITQLDFVISNLNGDQ